MATDPAKPSLVDQLVKRVEDLERLLNPQTLRNRLERTYDPRGGEPRIIDENGRTLDYAPAIQFPGSVTTLDAPNQRVLVEVPTPELVGVFSDNTTTTNAEMLRFVGETNPAIIRSAIKTSTVTGVGAQREVRFALAESNVEAAPRVMLRMMNGDVGNPSISRTAELRVTSVASNNDCSLHLSSAPSTDITATNFAILDASRVVGGGSGVGSAQLDARTTNKTVVFQSRASELGGGLASVEFALNGGSKIYYVLNDRLTSHFVQTTATTATPLTAVQRHRRGPFTVSVAALAALGTQASTLTNARNGSDYVVEGGIDGGAGSELLQWSWTNAGGANDVTINIKNTDTVNALTATLRFYVTSTS